MSLQEDPGERPALKAGESSAPVSLVTGSPGLLRKPQSFSTPGDMKRMSLPLTAKMKP